MRNTILSLAVWACCLLSIPVASGQAVSGTINGLVTDPSGAAVVGASVTVMNTRTGATVRVFSTATGFYAVPNLPPSVYTVTAEAPGFKQFVQTNASLSLDSIVRVECPLEVGNIAESVSVTAEEAVLKTDKADVSAVITDRTLTDLPVLNRNASQLVSLLPGALRGTTVFVGENPSLDSNGFVNGAGGRGNYHQLDGIDNQETFQGVAMINSAVDSLQEIKITTNSYDAEFGQVAGAVFQASTKSGSNEYHGTLFEYIQNNKFFARNPFTESTTKVAPWRWNQFGGSIGGPIKKDRLFFFSDWQAMRSRQGATIQLNLPTPEFKRGDFSAVRSTNPIFDPLTGDQNGRGRLLFPNNSVPAARFHPATSKLVAALPDPNTPDPSIYFRNFVKSGSFIADTDGLNTRIDYNHSANTRIFARYTYLRLRFDAQPVLGLFLGGLGPAGTQNQVGGTRTQNLAFNVTRVVRANLVGELRVGFTRFLAARAQSDVGLKTAREIGIPGINKDGDPLTDGLPDMAIDGPVSNFNLGIFVSNFYEVEQSLQFVNNWTLIKGSHSLKWGADLRPRTKFTRIGRSVRGSFTFTRFGTASADAPGATGLGFASFLLGHSRNYIRSVFSREPLEFQDRHGLFVQDQWRVNRKLALTLGLRYEFFSPWYANEGGFSNFDFNTAEALVSGVGDVDKYAGVQANHRNFGPRLGLAYSFSPRNVLRMGYGLSFISVPARDALWPVHRAQSENAPTLYTAAFPLSQGPPEPAPAVIPPSGRVRFPDGQTLTGTRFDERTESLHTWNLALQRRMSSTITAEAAYLGHAGRNLARLRDANAAQPGPGPLPQRKLLGTRFGLAQPISLRANEGNSSFHSMQIRVDKRFSKGTQFLISYTWQKTIFDTYQNPFDRSAYKNLNGPRRWLTLSYVWELPFARSARSVTKALLGGWQVSGITQLQDGSPLSPTMIANTLNVDSYTQLPDRIGSGFVDNPDRNRWFDVSAFRVPPPFTFGNSGLGIFNSPGSWVADVSLNKSFHFRTPLNEQTRLAFRWELFNTLNHVNLGSPDTRIDAPASQAGKIFNIQGAMRRMQMGLHLYF